MQEVDGDKMVDLEKKVEETGELSHVAAIDVGKYKEFLSHDCYCKKTPASHPGVGQQLSFTYSPNAVFTAVSVHCSCGKEEDITDYDRA